MFWLLPYTCATHGPLGLYKYGPATHTRTRSQSQPPVWLLPKTLKTSGVLLALRIVSYRVRQKYTLLFVPWLTPDLHSVSRHCPWNIFKTRIDP
jgi:hypothetical protein